jgi:voltage-gated potassium channel
MRQRGLRYVLLLTTLITFLGAAGMYDFEWPRLNTYWDAVWWTAMIMTTIGSDYWPKTPEGRVLAFLLSVYAFSIFGFITASLASFLIGKEKESSSKNIEELRSEIQRLSSEINRFSERKKSNFTKVFYSFYFVFVFQLITSFDKEISNRGASMNAL